MTAAETLRHILSEPIQSVKKREATTFDLACAGRSDLVLHGAGRLGRKTLAGLRALGREPLAFTDNNKGAWGSQIDCINVMSPAEAARRYADRATFVICTWSPCADRTHAVITDSLKAAGCHSVTSFIPLFWKHAETFLPHYRLESPHKIWEASNQLMAAFELFDDERSREEYVRQVEWMISPELLTLPFESSTDELCFPKGLFQVSDHEVFADCGAYDGDTLRNFLDATDARFSHAYGFEPDPLNFKKLEDYVASLPSESRGRITVRAAAVGSEAGTLLIEPTGTVSSIISDMGSVEVPCIRLDDELKIPPTYVQMDIEGFEPYALQGAEKIIREHSPRLAVRVYHQQDHLWSLPLQIKSYHADYRFYLRRHGDEFGDVVCYALPD